jgi:orotate phosphoribosyltransferase
MTEKEVEGLLRESGAFLQGHFLYASKLHGSVYIEKFRALEDPGVTSIIATEMIARADAAGIVRPRVVVGPMTGGALLAFEVARQIGAKAYFTEKMEGTMELRRGFHLESNESVWVTEDVVNLGGSIQQVFDCIEGLGAKVSAALILVDRSKGRVKVNAPFIPLLRVTDLIEYPPDQCPLCKQGIPLAALGGRKVITNKAG